MPQSADVDMVPGAWTQLTNADAAGIVNFQLKKPCDMHVKATVGAVAPTSFAGAFVYGGNRQGEMGRTLAEMFPGITGATRLYGYVSTSNTNVKVAVQHA